MTPASLGMMKISFFFSFHLSDLKACSLNHDWLANQHCPCFNFIPHLTPCDSSKYSVMLMKAGFTHRLKQVYPGSHAQWGYRAPLTVPGKSGVVPDVLI